MWKVNRGGEIKSRRRWRFGAAAFLTVRGLFLAGLVSLVYVSLGLPIRAVILIDVMLLVLGILTISLPPFRWELRLLGFSPTEVEEYWSGGNSE